jgi:5,10-methylenetetrahydromethanopterin reductase
MEVKLGVGLWQTVTAQNLVELTELAEDLGYHQLWYGNHKLYRDMYVGLALAAYRSRTMEIGTFISEPYSYHPAMIAAAIGTIDEICGHRAILCLGAGAANFKELGLKRTMPLTAIKETIEICRRLFTGDKVSYKGEMFSVEDSWLHFETRPDLPIYVATRGDKMFRLSGEIADGVMVATYASPAGIQQGLDLIDEGGKVAGRTWEEMPIISRVDACVHPDREVARNAVRPMISMLLMGSYPDRNFVHRLGLEVPEALERICEQKNELLSIQNGHLVPDEFVDAYAWAGTAEEVAHKVAAVVDMGINQITYLPHPPQGEGFEPNLTRFAMEVMPRVKALLKA